MNAVVVSAGQGPNNSKANDVSQNPPDRPDVFSWVLEDYQAIKKPTWQDTLNLYGDAYLIIVAGR